jgi:hypothetical protein
MGKEKGRPAMEQHNAGYEGKHRAAGRDRKRRTAGVAFGALISGLLACVLGEISSNR